MEDYAYDYDQQDPADKKKRKFVLVTPQGQSMGHTFRNASPYAAAMKAANRGFEDIILFEPAQQKVHRYCGCMRDIQEDEHTDYTRRHGITQKASVKSVKTPRTPVAATSYKHTRFYDDGDDADGEYNYNDVNGAE